MGTVSSNFMSDFERVRKVDEWFQKNSYLFKTDTYYGIEIIAELNELVKSCTDKQKKSK